ncbi:hypothetical protein [Nocardia sp. IFM 10818]
MKAANLTREYLGVVITGTDSIHADHAVAIARVRDTETVPSARNLLSVPIPGRAAVGAVYDIAAFPCSWFTQRHGVLDEASMIHLRAALKAYFDLND